MAEFAETCSKVHKISGHNKQASDVTGGCEIAMYVWRENGESLVGYSQMHTKLHFIIY
jgi:hypothetical protein